MQPDYDFDLEAFYSYGFRGRNMMAVRAPFAMTNDGVDFIGRRARIGGHVYRIAAISRQISGPIAKGEPIGVEVMDAYPELRSKNKFLDRDPLC